MKYVRDHKAAQSISAYVILDPAHEYVGRVQVYHGDLNCRVDLWSKPDWTVRQAKTSGGNQDIFALALDGLEIDGIRLYDDCTPARDVYPEYTWFKGVTSWSATSANMIEVEYPDVSFANWDPDNQAWRSCYIADGFDRLRKRGYTVIQAI